jgi:hypothetical protein
MKELDEAEVKANRVAQILLKSLKEIKGEINEMKDNIDNMKKYASNLQTFLCMKQLEPDVMLKMCYFIGNIKHLVFSILKGI